MQSRDKELTTVFQGFIAQYIANTELKAGPGKAGRKLWGGPLLTQPRGPRGGCLFFLFAALGLRCCMRAFSSCGERGLLFVAVRWLLVVAASLVVERGL